MEINIVQKREFGRALPLSRCDAEYVWKSLWEIESGLRKRDGWPLADLVADYDGPTLNDKYYAEDATVSYIDIDSIDTSDGLTYADELLYADRPSRAKYRVRQGDLLVSNVRPNRGATTLITSYRDGALASSGFSLLRDKKRKDAPQTYLLAFLKSGFGRTQLKRRCRGSMYPAVTVNDLRKIWVPKPPEKVLHLINAGVQRVIALHVKFFELVKKQNEFLGAYLKPFEHPPSPLEGNLNEANWTVIKKRDVDAVERIDAEFFRHEYREFDERLQAATRSFLLGEHFDLAAGRGLGSGEDTVPFVKQGVLTNAGVNWSALSYEQGALKRGGNVRPEDILLACTAHEVYYVGRKVDYVRDVPEEIRETNSAVPDLMVIRPRDGSPAALHGSFVAAFLRSPTGLHQVQRCIRGLRGGHVYKNDLSRHVRAPLPKQSWLDAFEETAAAYESVRAEAKREMQRASSTLDDWLNEGK